MKKLSDILSEMEKQGFELGKIYTDKDRPPFKVNEDKEGKMAKYDAKEIADDAMDVFKMIKEEDDLPEWLEAKITKAGEHMNAVKDYLTHHHSGTNEAKLTEKSDIPRWEIYIKGEREPFVIASESSREAKKLAYMMLKNHNVKIKRIKQI